MNDLYRTMLFVPGNNPGKMVKAEIYGADCIIFDLEDAVSVNEKDAARDLVISFLSRHRPQCCRVGVRINGWDTPYYEEDVKSMVPLKPDFLRLPKTETAEHIKLLDALLTEQEKAYGIDVGSIKIVATIETALGVYNAYNIASASDRMLAIGLGAEDFRTDMRMSRSEDGSEIYFARNMISLAAHAAGIKAIDYVYSNFKNEEGFVADVKLGKSLGYSGKSVIHPNQILLVHGVYEPNEKEIEHSKKVLAAYETAMQNASGVISLDGKMIDMPIVTRAKAIISLAKASGKEV